MELWAKPPAALPTAYSSRASAVPQIGDQRSFVTTNPITGASSRVSFTLRYCGEHCNIWLESRDRRGVSEEMIVELGAEYDVYIHSRVTTAFGPTMDRDGDGKIAILLYDVQDGFSGSGGRILTAWMCFTLIPIPPFPPQRICPE